jgi:hypothetical protein
MARTIAEARDAAGEQDELEPNHLKAKDMPRCDAAGLALALAATMFAGLSSAPAKSFKWNCVYAQKASPEGLAKDSFKMEFAYDDITGKGVLIGNLGVSDIEVHRGPYGVTFLEKLGGGAVQTTTVANDGKSVHSRHTIIMGKEMVPSQFYGQCTVR